MANIKYSKKLAKRICELIESGLTITEICNRKDIGVSDRTVRNWRTRYKEFDEMCIESYIIYIMLKQDELFALSKKPLPKPTEIAKKYNLNIDNTTLIKHYITQEVNQIKQEIDVLKFTIAKILPRLSPKDADKIEVKNTGQSIVAINVQKISEIKDK